MTTLLHLNQTVIDMQQELAREQRFATDSCHSLLKGIALLREATDALERDIKSAFEERDRAISRVLGGNVQITTQPSSEASSVTDIRIVAGGMTVTADDMRSYTLGTKSA